MRGQKEKKVRIQSEFSKNNNDEKTIENRDQSLIDRQKKGRPCKDKEELRVSRVKMNCNDNEKRILYDHFNDSGDMRDYLLKAIKDGEV